MATTDPRKKLREPFPADKIKTKPGRGKDGRPMSFISHGLITERLNEVDPEWESIITQVYTSTGPDGRLHCEGVSLAVTVLGKTHEEVGGPQRQDGFTNEVKNAASDALKRAAMRFGVALEMWESLVDAEDDEDYAAEAYQAMREDPLPKKLVMISETQRKQLWATAREVWPKDPADPDKAFDPADVAVHDEIGRKWRITSVNDLTAEQAAIYIQRLKDLRAKAPAQTAMATNAPQRRSPGNDRYTNA
jgi:hypothetical protein